MAAPQFAPEPTLTGRTETREVRVRFANPQRLLEGLARARTEPWVVDARVDADELVLVMGASHAPGLQRVH